MVRAVDRVTLHQHMLDIERVTLRLGDEHTEYECAGVEPDNSEQTVVVHLGRTVAPGRATLLLVWRVDVASIPKPPPGQKGWAGLFFATRSATSYDHITQFEPCNARQAYPCFDQPCTKATFRLTLENVPLELTALSNTAVESEHVNEVCGRARMCVCVCVCLWR